ncbi:hypothetical protein OQA88_11043 [Cercophora sp. LCS_1]
MAGRGGHHGFWATIKEWLFEVICLVGSVAFFFTMVAFLRVHDNRPLPALPASLSLNSIIAALTIVSKGCFTVPLVECLSQWKWNWFHRPRSVKHFDRFDQASRGLWGSAILVWKLRFGHAAALGAFIYIISILVSLFTQGSIGYESGEIETGSPRSAPVREVYHWGLDEVSALSVDAALLTGLFDTDKRQQVADIVPTCPTSSCRYPPITTLSVCSSVVNITSSLTTTPIVNATSHPWTFLSSSTALLFGNTPAVGTGPSDIIRNATSGISISLSGLNQTISIPQLDAVYLTALPTSTVFTSDPRYQVGLVNMLAVFYSGNSRDRNPNDDIAAYEILFHTCVNTYNITSTNNTASAVVTSSYHTPVSDGAGARRPLSCGVVNSTACYDAVGRDSHVALELGNKTYSADSVSLEYVGTAIARYLSGWRATDLLSNTAIDGYPSYRLMDLFGPDPANAASGAQLEDMMARAAAGINGVFQGARWGNSAVVYGTAWENTIFVRVRWAWLALLAGEITLATVFCGYTMYATARMGVKPLKSSSFATLLALDGDSRTAVEDVVGAGKEKRIEVRLRDRRLVLNEESDRLGGFEMQTAYTGRGV